jgi:hypothetical protein
MLKIFFAHFFAHVVPKVPDLGRFWRPNPYLSPLLSVVPVLAVRITNRLLYDSATSALVEKKGFNSLFFAPILPTSIKLQSTLFPFPIALPSSTIEHFYPPSFMITLRATWSCLGRRAASHQDWQTFALAILNARSAALTLQLD